ncbi:unnamed protein product [Psylliodes chrysocephalus]|uniref:Uncharacterized protein n=1 Tax=Psylliodes chrysocephalus TaxID=3402493 RepID=A0A9P0G448_9CUCU|nr:unnamed protein product [Psylliodes chrysocephala]
MTRFSLKDTEKNDTIAIPECEEPLLKSSSSANDDIFDKQYLFMKISLKSVDIILASTIFCFLVICCWRGAWELFDIYDNYFPTYESFCLTMVIYLVLALSQHTFQDIVDQPAETSLRKYFNLLIMKMHFYILLFATIMLFRTGSNIYDDIVNVFHGIGLKFKFWDDDCSASSVILTVIVVAVLTWIRGMANLTTAPMDITCDGKDDIFLIECTFFKMGERTSLYVLDCLFSILVVGTLVVFVWRGVWQLIDIFLFPNDEIFSSWSSLVLGYLVVASAFLLQPLMKYLCERLTGTTRLLIADTFVLYALFGTVNVWRGIWNLLNIYFLPDNLEMSCWITHWVSLIILILCRCSNSLLVRGVYIDAEEPAGKCVVFPCYYLRVIFRKKKLKKLNLATMSLNDTIKKVNHKESASNHVVKISTISDTVEENCDTKQCK